VFVFLRAVRHEGCKALLVREERVVAVLCDRVMGRPD
jgi:hypothetical protein